MTDTIAALVILVLNLLLAVGIGRSLRQGGAIFSAGSGVYLLLIAGAYLGPGLLPQDLSGWGYFGVILILVMVFGALMLLGPLGRSLRSIPQDRLLALQGLRAFYGASFISQAAFGLMPTDSGVLHGSMHVATATFCLFAAITFLRGSAGARGWILFANLFGLVDILTTAYGLAFVSFEQMGVTHSINLAVFWPAPVYFWLHLVSLWALRHPQDHQGVQ